MPSGFCHPWTTDPVFPALEGHYPEVPLFCALSIYETKNSTVSNWVPQRPTPRPKFKCRKGNEGLVGEPGNKTGHEKEARGAFASKLA